MNKLHRKKVVGRWSADHLLTTYQPSTHHPPTTNYPFMPWWISCKTVDFMVKQTLALSTLKMNHLPTTYWPPTNHLPTTYRPSTDHLPTTYRPSTDHLPTTYRLPFYGAACSQRIGLCSNLGAHTTNGRKIVIVLLCNKLSITSL